MVAALIEVRTFLRQVIGLGHDPEGLERSNTVIDEGVDSTNELAKLYDDDGIKHCAAMLKKTGESILDPAWVAPDPNPNAYVAPNVAKPGKYILTICEQRLMLAVYGAKVYTSISRPIVTVNLSKSRLNELK